MIKEVGGKPERYPMSKAKRVLRSKEKSRVFMPQKCHR